MNVALRLSAPALACSALFAACAPPRADDDAARTALTLQRPAFGVMFEYELAGVPESDARSALEAAAKEVERVESLLSSWRNDSQLAQVNQSAAIAPVAVDPLLFDVLTLALDAHEFTRGAFDPTIGPLMAVWGWRPNGEPRVPSDAELAAAEACVGVRHVIVDRARRTVGFDRAGVSLDLDGIAKGVAVDRAILVLRAHGVRSALVSGGGSSVACIGGPRKVAIAGPDGATLHVVEITDASVSTSGNWQRERTQDGVKIGHLFDPRTGRPIDDDVVSVSVIAPTAAESDAWDTAIAVGGSEAEAAANARSGLRVIVVRRGG